MPISTLPPLYTSTSVVVGASFRANAPHRRQFRPLLTASTIASVTRRPLIKPPRAPRATPSAPRALVALALHQERTTLPGAQRQRRLRALATANSGQRPATADRLSHYQSNRPSQRSATGGRENAAGVAPEGQRQGHRWFTSDHSCYTYRSGPQGHVTVTTAGAYHAGIASVDRR